jgi:hypothetical protein
LKPVILACFLTGANTLASFLTIRAQGVWFCRRDPDFGSTLESGFEFRTRRDLYAGQDASISDLMATAH